MKLPDARVHVLTARDFRGALGVFLLVTVTTFPMVVPFLVFDDAVRALRWSHGVALLMLFLIGWVLGRHAGMRPLLTGLSMLAIGVVLAIVTILLGG
jgi:predicted membrane protein (TIGR00267 family)